MQKTITLTEEEIDTIRRIMIVGMLAIDNMENSSHGDRILADQTEKLKPRFDEIAY